MPAALQRVEFHLLWFSISLMAFIAPVALVPARPQPRQLMFAFFIPWLASLVVLFFVSRGYRASGGEDERGRASPPEA